MIKKTLSLCTIIFVLAGCTTTPEKPAKVISHETQQAISELQKGLYIYFDSGSSKIDPKYDIYFTTASYLLASQPNLIISVEGHADSRGLASLNQHLSLSRATAVKNKLVINNNVNPNQLRAVGFGSSEPAYDNSTAEGRANNRRVKITVHTQ